MLVAEFLGLLAFGFVLAVVTLRPRQAEKIVSERLRKITSSRDEQTERDDPTLPLKQTSGLVDKLGSYIQRFDFSKDLQLLIMHAGSDAKVGAVVGGSFLAAAGAGLMAHLALGVLPLDIGATIAGGASRWGVLKFQKSRRLKKFNQALPDAIDLLARALRAGHSMSSAIEVVAEQSPEPLGSEYDIVFQQQKLGIQFRDALLQLGDRVPSKDLHFLITAILVQKETGGDLTEVLDRTTRIIRERIRIHGEIQTHTAQGRLTGWILSGLPIIMLVLINIVNPGYSHILFYDPLGQKLLYAGGAMIVLGAVIIRKIVDIEV